MLRRVLKGGRSLAREVGVRGCDSDVEMADEKLAQRCCSLGNSKIQSSAPTALKIAFQGAILANPFVRRR
jgi:hypothetical protein